jgi:hypothetical protein
VSEVRAAGSRVQKSQSLVVAFICLAVLPAHAHGASPRKIAIRVTDGFSLGSEFERFSGWARREGVELEVGPESSPGPAGSEVVHVAVLPASEALARLVARFPIRLTGKEFAFDGRTYGQAADAIALTDPSRPETFVIGVGRQAALRLLARRLFWGEEDRSDYRVVSGELAKSGRFARASGPLAIDRLSDRDEIATRESFRRSLAQEERAGNSGIRSARASRGGSRSCGAFFRRRPPRRSWCASSRTPRQRGVSPALRVRRTCPGAETTSRWIWISPHPRSPI